MPRDSALLQLGDIVSASILQRGSSYSSRPKRPIAFLPSALGIVVPHLPISLLMEANRVALLRTWFDIPHGNHRRSRAFHPSGAPAWPMQVMETRPMLPVPVEITFHNIESVAWAEEEIRARIAKLAKIYNRLVACRVRVVQRANNPAGTIPPVVRIEMGIPGRSDLVVSHEPEHLWQKFRNPDLRDAIREAFRIAEVQLTELKRKLDDRSQGDVFRETENQMLGQVANIDSSGDFGFILTNTGGRLYFHRNSVLTGTFEDLRRGDEVYYVEEMGDTGPTASKVRVKEEAEP